MKLTRRQFGLTLTELLVTVAVAAVLMALAVPAARRITETMRDSAGARALIGAALNNARAIAVREGRYAGVRFQQTADGKTYMIFIVHDPSSVAEGGTGLANGFRPVKGRKPILLPDDFRLAPGGQTSFYSIVFSRAGRLTVHPVRYKATLSFGDLEISDDTQDVESVNVISVFDTLAPGDLRITRISPYTGELIGE